MNLTRKILVFAALAMLPPVGVQAQDGRDTATEEWRCFSVLDFSRKNVLVRLTREMKHGVDLGCGRIIINGVTHDAWFEIAGIDRRWDFGADMQYAFVIHLDGSGAYYDFSTVEDGAQTGPSQLFRCVRRQG